MINRLYRTISVLVIILGLMLYSSSFLVALATSPTEKNVLFLHAYTPDYPIDKLYDQGVKSILDKNSLYKFSYSYEYFDLARHPNEKNYFGNMAKYLKFKYTKHQPDFIITSTALYPLVFNYGEELFPSVPIIMQWYEETVPLQVIPSNYMAIPTSVEINDNIQLILQTRPLTKTIYMVIGNSEDEQNRVKRILQDEKKYRNQVEFVLLNKQPYAQMLESVKNVEGHSAILFFSWISDIDGKAFIPANVLKTICSEAKVPVYGVASTFLGSGIVGGYLNSFELIGQTAGNTVLGLLAGKKPSDNPVIHSTYTTLAFDWRALKRWGIDEHKLPSGSKIEFRELSVWDLYGGYIMGGTALLGLQALLIVSLLVNRSKRIKAEGELSQNNISLEKTVLERTHELRNANDQLKLSKEQLETLNTQLDLTSRTDILTGLFNRRHAEEKIKEEYQKYRRNGKEFVVVMADIDFFKKVNDTYGHDTGDIILKSISQSLRESVRMYDIIARWGGEEFLLLLPETKSESAELLLERIRKTVEENAYTYIGGTLSITMTFGLSAIGINDTIVDVIKRADDALYQGKKIGRNCVITA